MRKLITAVLIFVTVNLFAGTEKTYFYDCSIEKDSISKVVQNWTITTDLRTENKNSEVITLLYENESTYLQKKKVTPYGTYQFRIQIFIKDGKLKLRSYDFTHKTNSQYLCSGGDLESPNSSCTEDQINSVMWQEFQKQSKDKAESFIQSFEIFLKESLGEPNKF